VAQHSALGAPEGAGYGEPTDGEAGITCEELERAAAPSVDAFNRTYARPRRPVVVSGLTEGWRAREEWTPHRLAARYGDLHLIAARLRNGELAEHPKLGVQFHRLQLRDFVSSLDHPGGATDYVMAPPWEFPTSLQDDYRIPTYCTDATYLQVKVWVAKACTVTSVHRDLPANLHTQIYGRKLWLLFSPRQSSLLYPRSPFASLPNHAWADIHRPDFTRHPRLRQARALRAVVGPGETTFVPSGWWHYARSLDNSVSINFWYGGRLILLAKLLSAAFKRIRNIHRGEWG
jgi:lysine-specific demethylase 8